MKVKDNDYTYSYDHRSSLKFLIPCHFPFLVIPLGWKSHYAPYFINRKTSVMKIQYKEIVFAVTLTKIRPVFFPVIQTSFEVIYNE
jgi:hypothetical protein